MKYIAITNEGIEEITGKETPGKIIKIEPSVVIFEAEEKETKQFCYSGQSIVKVLEYIDSFDIDDIFFQRLHGYLEKTKVNKTFKAKCKRIGNHPFSSQQIEEEIGNIITKNNKTKVQMNDPDTIIYAYLYKNKCYLGIDITTIDLSKRDYKIFIHPSSLKGTTAYALIAFAGYDNKKTLLDPFCGSGTILIEAALKGTNKSQNYYSKNKFKFGDELEDNIKDQKLKIYGYDFQLKHIKAARKNAKIAGVDDKIEMSKVDISWLDTKFKQWQVDMIVTDPPKLTKFSKDYGGLMKEFFYQAKYLVNKKGNITLLTNEKSIKIIEEEGKKYDFIISSTMDIAIGQEKGIIVKFIKEK